MRVKSSIVALLAVNLLLVGSTLAANVPASTSTNTSTDINHDAHSHAHASPAPSIVGADQKSAADPTPASTEAPAAPSSTAAPIPISTIATEPTPTTTTPGPVPESSVATKQVSELTTGSPAASQTTNTDDLADQANFASGRVEPSKLRNDESAQSMRSVMPKTPDMIDLSWPLENKTIHWPTNEGFQYFITVEGKAKVADFEYHRKSDAIKMAIHTGTHLDAPRHFSAKGQTVDQIPLRNLEYVPVQVIDVSHLVKKNRSYQIKKEDFLDPSSKESLVQEGAVVLVYTSISDAWDLGANSYFDFKNTSDYTTMQVPGFTIEAAKFLVAAKVVGVGLDAPTADSQYTSDGKLVPHAHVELNENNIFILENVGRELAQLVGTKEKWRLLINPLPIADGSGSPVRLVAIKESLAVALSSAGAPILHPTMPLLLLLVSLFTVRRWIYL